MIDNISIPNTHPAAREWLNTIYFQYENRTNPDQHWIDFMDYHAQQNHFIIQENTIDEQMFRTYNFIFESPEYLTHFLIQYS